MFTLRRGDDRLHVHQLFCKQLGALFCNHPPGAGHAFNYADAGQSFLVCSGGGGSGGLYSTVRNQEIQRRLIIPGKIKRSLIYELPHTIAFI